jgi:hypothetical protein
MNKKKKKKLGFRVYKWAKKNTTKIMRLPENEKQTEQRYIYIYIIRIHYPKDVKHCHCEINDGCCLNMRIDSDDQ